MDDRTGATIGVVIVTFRSEDVVVEALESLFASEGVTLKVVVVDNASPDDTCGAIRGWASGQTPFQRPPDSPLRDSAAAAKPIALAEYDAAETVDVLGPLTLIRSRVNLGYAGGVNLGLKALQGRVDWCWILNPDCVTPPQTAATFLRAAQAHPGFSLMSCRTLYYHRPDLVQVDGGGVVDRRTGSCRPTGMGAPAASTPPPAASQLDWISGANMFVSPQFLERVGPMEENYFLYYEEVDWAHRRGDLPLALASDAVIYHHGGTAIGSGNVELRPSAFASYFNHRNRVRFAKRFISRLPLWAYLFGFGKALQVLLEGGPSQAQAIVAGMLEAPPPREVAARLAAPETARLAFGASAGGGRKASGQPRAVAPH